MMNCLRHWADNREHSDLSPLPSNSSVQKDSVLRSPPLNVQGQKPFNVLSVYTLRIALPGPGMMNQMGRICLI